MKQQNRQSRKRQVFSCKYLLLLLVLSACSKVMHVSKTDVHSVPVDSPAQDSSVLALISPYREQMWNEMEEVIGTNAVPLHKGKPESTLGNWIADAMEHGARQRGKVEIAFALSNYGGIRVNILAAGPLKVGAIYEVMPFNNLITVVQMQGSEVQQMLDQIAQDGGWPVSHSLRMAISDKAAVDISIGGSSLDHTATYHVAMPDYVAQGGDGRELLRNLPHVTLDYLVRNALIDHVRDLTARGLQLTSEKDDRIRLAGAR